MVAGKLLEGSVKKVLTSLVKTVSDRLVNDKGTDWEMTVKGEMIETGESIDYYKRIVIGRSLVL